MSSEVEALEQRREDLKKRLEAIQKDLGRGLPKDYEDQSIRLENMEVLEEIARVTEEELRKVEMQLARLREKG